VDRVEYTIIRNLVRDEDFARKVVPFIDPEYFSVKAERTIIEQIISFFGDYNASPTPEALAIDLGEKRGITESEYKEISETLSFIAADAPAPDADWLVDTTEKFCKDRAVFNAVKESIGILDGEGDATKEAIPEILSKALGVSFDTNVGHDYLEDSEQRYEFYHNTETHIPFDLDYFNKITNGGLVPKTFNVLMGGPGTGKTLVMCHMAAAYLAQGKNVLYVTMEMAEERISERIDANLLNVPIKDIQHLTREKYDDKIGKLRNKTDGKLIVKEYPTSQAGVAHFRHLLNELKLKKDWSPEIIFVDYLNICMSSRFKFGANVNSYTYIKSIAEELRGLAVEREVVLISATQVNREGYGSSDIAMENVSESFGLPATADLFLGIITNDELQELNQLMIKQLKNRYNDPTENAKFVVGVDRSKMRLYDCEQKAQEDIDDGPAFDNTGFGSRDSGRDFSGIKVL
jgi:replicative DNA helicase